MLIDRVFTTLFGPNWASGFAEKSALTDMLAAFNAVIFLLLAVVLLYVLAVAMIGTAHEGVPLGRRLHSVWTPIRWAGAIVLIAPIPPAGICLLQSLMLVAFGFSNEKANDLTEILLDGRVKMVSQAQYMPPVKRAEAEQTAIAILDNLLIQEYLHRSYADAPGFEEFEGFSSVRGEWKQKSERKSFGREKLIPQWEYVFAGAGGREMGSITVDCGGFNADVCDKLIGVANEFHGEIDKIANFIFAKDLASLGVSAEVLRGRGTLTDDVIRAAALNYAVEKYLQAQIEIARLNQTATFDAYEIRAENWTQTAREMGWAGLGAYYNTLSVGQAEAAAALQFRVTATAPAESARPTSELYREFRQIADKYTRAASLDLRELSRSGKAATDSGGRIIDWVLDYVNPSQLLVSWLDKTQNEDPLAAASAVGHVIISGAAGLFGAQGIASLLSWAPGVGSVVESISAVVKVLAGILFGAGVWLAYVLPAIPFILYTLGVLTVILLFFMGFVAAPLWALGIALPDGEGFFGQNGRAGLMLFLGGMLRSIILVIGFGLAVHLLQPLAALVAAGFSIFVGGEQAGGASAWSLTGRLLVGPFVCMALLAAMLSILVNKVFSLCTHLPDEIIQWLGGPGTAHLGAADDRGTEFVAGKTLAAGAAVGGVAGAASARTLAGSAQRGTPGDHAPGDKTA